MTNKNDLRLLSTYNVFDVTPEMIQESVEQNDGKVILNGVLQKADTLNQNGRIYPRNILEREVRNYQKFILEGRAVGELDHPDTCVPTGTEIFTDSGWKHIENVFEGEMVMTIDPLTEKVSFQRVERKIDEEWSGDLIRLQNSKSIDFSFTPNHRVLMWDRNGKHFFARAQDMLDGNVKQLDHCSLRFSSSGTSNSGCESIVVAGHKFLTHDWAAFLGIYLAEGSCVGTKQLNKQRLSRPLVHQSRDAHPETYDEIKNLLKRMGIYAGSTDRWHYVDSSLYFELVRLGNSHNKYVPSYVFDEWSIDQIKILCEWMLKGDGSNVKPYTTRSKKRHNVLWALNTTSPQLATDFETLMYMIGSGATTDVHVPVDRSAPDFKETGRMIMAENSKVLYHVRERVAKNASMNSGFTRVFSEPYLGMIHCVVTENQTWLMRQNGKTCWTGNSVINLKNASHKVTAATMDGDVVRGKVQILSTPSGEILRKLINDGVKLGISSRGVGTTTKQGDYYVVQDDFQLICWDFVSEPSTPGAFMLPEGKVITTEELRKTFNKSDRIDRILNDILSYKDEE